MTDLKIATIEGRTNEELANDDKESRDVLKTILGRDEKITGIAVAYVTEKGTVCSDWYCGEGLLNICVLSGGMDYVKLRVLNAAGASDE